jgi:AcrR family transcriptional regulator
MKRRKAGRPVGSLVDRARLMKAVLELLEEGGLEAVTMRALGKRLGVNAMAAYHYFENRDALLQAAAAQRYRQFRPRLNQRTAPARLLELGLAYARSLRQSRQLLVYLVTTEAALAGPAEHFGRLFTLALGSTALAPEGWQAARNAFADLVHGFALAGPEAPLRFLSDELRLLIHGMSDTSTGPATGEPGDDMAGRKR